MNSRFIAASATGLVFALSFGVASAQSVLAVSCSGMSTATSVTWMANTTGGIAPVALLWGNGATSSSQTVTYAPGIYSMSIQATDASSSVASSTCSATVAQAQTAPFISSFVTNPASITAGQSTTLSWTVVGASSTSIGNNVGVVSGTSVSVSPTTNTTYTLTAVNPNGTTTAQATVDVNATSTSSSVQSQIAALLQQIVQLQQQLRNLLSQTSGSATSTLQTIPPGQVGKGMCIALNRNLSEGDNGGDVMQLQQILASEPSTGFNASPTGFFGPLTARAMMRFQEDNGIASSSSATGIVGPLTRGFFTRRCGEGLDNVQGDNGNNGNASSTVWQNSSEDGSTATSAPMQTLPSWGSGQGPSSEHGNNGNGRGQDN